MRHGRFIYILGDVHGRFNLLNDFINKKIRNDRALAAIAPYWKAEGDDLQAIILQCGDFAYYWPFCDSAGAIRNQVNFLPGGYAPVYWVGGNHEDWDQLEQLGAKITEVDRGVFYCPFGATLQISPDITVLFAGGAESVDKDWRLQEMRKGSPKIWWEQEGVSEADLQRLDQVARADWVISHTAPNAFAVEKCLRNLWSAGHLHEPSRDRLEEIFLRYAPKNWWFGHFHQHMAGRIDGCDWECLDALDNSGKAWEKIYLEWED